MSKEEFLEYKPIQNEGFVGEVIFEDWEDGEDVFSDMKKIVAHDAMTIILQSKKRVKQFLNEENIPFKIHMTEIYLHSPNPFHVVKVLEEFCVYGGSKYITLFLGRPCEFRLEQFGKKGKWDIGRHLSGNSVAITLLGNDPVLYVSAQNEQDCENFMELIDTRLDDQIIPFMTYEENSSFDIAVPPDFLKAFDLPDGNFRRIFARLLNDPNEGGDDTLHKLYADDALQMIAISSFYDDVLDELQIDYHLENKMLLSEPVKPDVREDTLEKLHSESFMDRVYLFYASQPNYQVKKGQPSSLFKKIFSSKATLDFNLEKNGKAVVLVLDGELAIIYENE